MNKSSSELIHRYLAGIATDDQVRELEARLLAEDQLQDEFLFQSEVDAHLRQEAQSITKPHVAVDPPSPSTSPTLWKWISGVTTLAATILVAIVLLSSPPHREAMAHPSLGELTVDIPQSGQNIWMAAADGDLGAIRKELEEPSFVNAKADCGLTPLHIATLAYHPAAVELLLTSGADVSLADREGNTALHMASFLGRTDLVRLLLKAGADPELRNHLGFSSLDNVAITWSAGLEDYYHHVERVLKTTLDLEQIRAERPQILRLLASEIRTPPDLKPSVSIWQAAMTGNTAAVEQHIRAGTDINSKEELSGSTPLMVATTFGQVEVVRFLISAGADLGARNNSGGTVLHVACFFCQPAIVELLLNTGANPREVNNVEFTPLDVVSIEFDDELDGVYRHVYESLGLKFDGQFVRRTRTQIAETLINWRLRSEETTQ
jgi:uncharacterized protein